jgi:hypothetical protein
LKYEILYPEKDILATAGTAEKPVKIEVLACFRRRVGGFPRDTIFSVRRGEIKGL